MYAWLPDSAADFDLARLRFGEDVGEQHRALPFIIWGYPLHNRVVQLLKGHPDLDLPAAMPDPSLYTVGWICAIPPEYIAAQAFLDEKHDRPGHISTNDINMYKLGRIGEHNFVIGKLPGEYGTAPAAAVAARMMISFPNVRVGLLVGVGGGAPSAKHDIRLGNVVVSAGSPSVYQYDIGKTIQELAFQTTGCLDEPPEVLRAAVQDIYADYAMRGHALGKAIDAVLEAMPRLQKDYQRPTGDLLFRSRVVHRNDAVDCATGCFKDHRSIVERAEWTSKQDKPAIHYGTIASANQVMKNARVRDRLAAEKNVLCFEMEAAGLMNRFPCLVIRGICDYADSHKNKQWQGYAAMAAAAYAKDLLARIPPTRLEAEQRIAAVPRIRDNPMQPRF